MKLTYRGQTYEIPALSQAGDAAQPKIKLIYRGHTYDYTPRSVVVPEAAADSKTVTLTYRGSTYERTLPAPKPYQEPRAINWRYRTSREG